VTCDQRLQEQATQFLVERPFRDQWGQLGRDLLVPAQTQAHLGRGP
jgi:hypothetical protein